MMRKLALVLASLAVVAAKDKPHHAPAAVKPEAADDSDHKMPKPMLKVRACVSRTRLDWCLRRCVCVGRRRACVCRAVAGPLGCPHPY